jgi:hypothetical protein
MWVSRGYHVLVFILQNEVIHVRFQVLTAARMKMAVFWVVAPCSLVEVYRRFRGSRCLQHQAALMM